jgi:hypothetical protein
VSESDAVEGAGDAGRETSGEVSQGPSGSADQYPEGSEERREVGETTKPDLGDDSEGSEAPSSLLIEGLARSSGREATLASEPDLGAMKSFEADVPSTGEGGEAAPGSGIGIGTFGTRDDDGEQHGGAVTGDGGVHGVTGSSDFNYKPPDTGVTGVTQQSSWQSGGTVGGGVPGAGTNVAGAGETSTRDPQETSDASDERQGPPIGGYAPGTEPQKHANVPDKPGEGASTSQDTGDARTQTYDDYDGSIKSHPFGTPGSEAADLERGEHMGPTKTPGSGGAVASDDSEEWSDAAHDALTSHLQSEFEEKSALSTDPSFGDWEDDSGDDGGFDPGIDLVEG